MGYESRSINIGSTQVITGVVGNVLFIGTGGVLQQNANFFWNNSYGFLAIGHKVPQAHIHIKVAGVAGLIAQTSLNTSSAGIACNNETGLTDGVGFKNYGTAVTGNRLTGIPYANLATFGKLGDGNFVVGTVGSGFLVLFTNDTEAMRIDSNQLVGIGTNTPLVRLHLQGSGTVAERIQQTTTTGVAALALFNNAGSSDQVLISNWGTATTGTEFGVNKTNLGVITKLGSTNANLAIGTGGAGFLVLGANNTEIVRISSTPLMAVTGDATISQRMAVGATATIDPEALLKVSETQSTAAPSHFGYGLHITPTLSIGDGHGGAFLRGISVIATVSGTGIDGTLQAIHALATYENTGNGATVNAISAKISTSGSASAPTNPAVIIIESPLFSGTKPVNYHGLLINNQGVSGITTSYGIKIEDQSLSGTFYSIKTGAGIVEFGGRVKEKQGADVASTNNLVLGLDGNTFEITGTTDINLISNLNWQNGSTIRLLFTETATVKDAQATSSTNITILLDGSADFNPTAGDNITLELNELAGVQAWREVGGRNVL